MEIKIITTHSVEFTIEAFWNKEGGMGSDQFGDTYTTLEEAIWILERARIASPKTDWIIVAGVTTKIARI